MGCWCRGGWRWSGGDYTGGREGACMWPVGSLSGMSAGCGNDGGVGDGGRREGQGGVWG